MDLARRRRGWLNGVQSNRLDVPAICRVGGGGMIVIDPDADVVTYINEFRCDARDQDEVVRINAEIIDRVESPAAGPASGEETSPDGRVDHDGGSP